MHKRFLRPAIPLVKWLTEHAQFDFVTSFNKVLQGDRLYKLELEEEFGAQNVSDLARYNLEASKKMPAIKEYSFPRIFQKFDTVSDLTSESPCTSIASRIATQQVYHYMLIASKLQIRFDPNFSVLQHDASSPTILKDLKADFFNSTVTVKDMIVKFLCHIDKNSASKLRLLYSQETVFNFVHDLQHQTCTSKKQMAMLQIMNYCIQIFLPSNNVSEGNSLSMILLYKLIEASVMYTEQPQYFMRQPVGNTLPFLSSTSVGECEIPNIQYYAAIVASPDLKGKLPFLLTNWISAKNGSQVRPQDCIPPFAADYIIKMDPMHALAVHSAFKCNSWTYAGGNLNLPTEACEEWQHHIDSSSNKIQSMMQDTNEKVNITLVFVIPIRELNQISNSSQCDNASGYFTLSESTAKEYNLSLPANVSLVVVYSKQMLLHLFGKWLLDHDDTFSESQLKWLQKQQNKANRAKKKLLTQK